MFPYGFILIHAEPEGVLLVVFREAKGTPNRGRVMVFLRLFVDILLLGVSTAMPVLLLLFQRCSILGYCFMFVTVFQEFILRFAYAR